MNVVEICKVSKSFGAKQVLNQINFCIASGEIFGLLGGNGAGKSTVTNIIFGLEEPTLGEIKLFGNLKPKEARKRMGLVPQDTAFYSEFTVMQNLKFFACAYGLGNKSKTRAEEVVKLVGLDGFEGMKSGNLSGGYQRLLNTAITLLHDPEVLFFDEPTVGLDPKMRRMFWDLIKKLNAGGKTIIITTHYMDEAEYLCSRIILLKKGNLLVEGTPSKLVDEYGGEKLAKFELLKELGKDNIAALSKVLKTKVTGVDNSIYFEEMKNNTLTAGNWLEKAGQEILSIDIKEPSLENAFINLLGEKAVEITETKKEKAK